MKKTVILMVHTVGSIATSTPNQVGLDEGLLSTIQFGMLVHKERLRSDRHRLVFSIVVLRLTLNRERDRALQTGMLSDLLFERLRLTDERGLDKNGDITVLLPHTDRQGAIIVSDSIVKLARDKGIKLVARIYTYPDSEADNNETNGGSDSFDLGDLKPASVEEYMSQDSLDSQAKTSFPKVVDNQRISFGCSLEMVSPKYPFWKRCSDILLSAIGLLCAAPVLCLAAFAIKATSSGPIFFLQWRTGQNAKPFRIYKLRTMVVDAEELKAKLRESNERDGPAFKMKFDPRVTRVGKFLRATGLDELPQLWNVLKGDMAIVGPRPLPCDEDASCDQWHRRRLDTKPGITCFWQIMKSRVVAFDDWMRLDLQYLRKRSMPQDIRLMMKTVTAVILGRVGH